MTDRYEEYCHADPVFFDSPSRGNDTGDFRGVLPEPSGDWSVVDKDVWRVLRPDGISLRLQGWKVHVSSGMDNAESVLRTAFDYCIRTRTPFKHLRGPNILLAQNSKYAHRGSSGKLVTIYPHDDEHLGVILAELGALLDGEKGPYILSDLRIGDGPLFVRYGGFLERSTVTANGTLVPAIQRPDGSLEPDQRRPRFQVPEWVTPPAVLTPHLDARRTNDDLPYRVTAALHFSNGGGVYLAERLADGTEVVLKEARPLAGLDRDGTDAVTRLTGEWRILRRLAGIPGIPAAHELFTSWEHHFLAMRKMPGMSLGRWLARHYPLTRHGMTQAQFADYTRRALHVLEQVDRLMTAVHERGIVFGDLHDRNLLIDTDDTVSLIDFEVAFDVAEPRRPALGAPGFAAPRDRTGFAIDEYAQAAVALYLFLPLHVVLTLDRGKLAEYLDVMDDRFDLPPGYTARIRDQLTPRVHPVSPTRTWTPDSGREPVADAIVASATPDRTDRLFPGDIETFMTGGATFECGAAGVLHALDACGFGRFPKFEDWLVDSVRREPPKKVGFYDGAHGVAYVLDNFGHHELAADLVAEYAPLVPSITDRGMRGGLSGIGLNLLRLADNWADDSLRGQAADIAERLVLAMAADTGPGSGAHAGLLHGWAGPALLFLRMHDLTGDDVWLDRAEQALGLDLAECVPTPDGSWQVRDGNLRTLPYLAVGSAGIAVAIEELAVYRPAAVCVARLPDLYRALCAEFVIQPGLLLGRAGQALALRRASDPELVAARERHLARLSWHAVPYRDRLAFPGNKLLRLSMDLGTGSAGVLLATCGRSLPFLTPAAVPVAAP
jgi:serine/threonine protein kinase